MLPVLCIMADRSMTRLFALFSLGGLASYPFARLNAPAAVARLLSL